MKSLVLTGIALSSLITGFTQTAAAQDTKPIPRISAVGEPKNWSHTRVFQPLSADQVAAADAACSKLDTPDAKYKGKGYSPQAENSRGAPLLNGGFLCTRRAPRFNEASNSPSLPDQLAGK
jgi:hypothetical protein